MRTPFIFCATLRTDQRIDLNGGPKRVGPRSAEPMELCETTGWGISPDTIRSRSGPHLQELTLSVRYRTEAQWFRTDT